MLWLVELPGSGTIAPPDPIRADQIRAGTWSRKCITNIVGSSDQRPLGDIETHKIGVRCT